MKKTTVLDCTLRDGGYYNDWNFSLDLARDVIGSIAASGVDIIELGYRSRVDSGFFGLFRFCNEELLRDVLPADGRAAYAFMIDAKEFAASAETADLVALKERIVPASESIFSWARVATHPTTMGAACQQVEWLKAAGYRVALNVMGISTLNSEALKATLNAIKPVPIDVLYMADSYGSLTPATTVSLLRALREGHDGALGVHMHENTGLALANTLAALEEGVEFVDATLSGMGRGAGNLRLEQLLLWMYFKSGRKDLKPAALLAALQKHMLPLQRRHGWGWDFSYMLSGLAVIHPTYCQELKAGAVHDIQDVAQILEDIPSEKRAKYDEKELLLASARYAARVHEVPEELPVTDAYQPRRVEEVLVVAAGPHVKHHAAALRHYIERHRPRVLECNDTGVLQGITRDTVVMNTIRMHELGRSSSAGDSTRKILTGLPSIPVALGHCAHARVRYSLRAGKFSVSDQEIILPGYVVGMLAVGLALSSQPKRLRLAGFDGFTGSERRAEQAEMETFWELARSSERAASVDFASLLPTSYSLPVRAIYGLL